LPPFKLTENYSAESLAPLKDFVENGRLKTSLSVRFQKIFIQSSSSDEEMSAVTLPHVGSLPRHEHRTQHNTPALVQEQLLKHLDFLHLHETGCWMFGLAGIVISIVMFL